jgi:hypothetical protein
VPLSRLNRSPSPPDCLFLEPENAFEAKKTDRIGYGPSASMDDPYFSGFSGPAF